MKKAQILSAIALAFALGVVAPVAGVINSASVSAYSEKDGTATYSDTTNAINYVENSNGYKAYQALIAANEAYKRGLADGSIGELANDGTTANAASDIQTAINDAQDANGLFGYNTTTISTNLSKEKIYTEQINAMIAAANSSDLYKRYVAIEDILANPKSTDAQLQNAVREFRVAAGPQGLGFLTGTNYDNLHPEQAKLANYRNSNPIASFDGYDEAVALSEAVEDAEEALAKYNKGYKLFIPLLNNSSIVTKDGKDVIAQTQNITLANLDAIATNSCADTCVAHYSDWAAVETELNTVKNNRRIDNSGDNYDLIFGLATDWQTAAGNEEKTTVVMARMVNYKASEQNPGSDSDTNPNLKPGNTGALNSAAEGTASTTVSIVAGLATALTALGAGVVAYRNARRSSEN